jgi:selenide,water dikinase
MNMSGNDVRLTELASCGGCAAKLGPDALAQVLSCFSLDAIGIGRDNVLVGLQPPDDAVVYKLDEKRAIVQHVDFFPPIVDEPYMYGAIAAANAMGDIYAKGGEVLWALNIVAFPEQLPIEILLAILKGGTDKIVEAGGFIAGGHSIWDDEPKYGMCVTGLVHPQSIWRKGGARKGDVLFLTKALGTGLIISAAKQGCVQPSHLQEAATSMMLLNRDAARCLHNFNPNAVTDITGFGILGHAYEMAEQSKAQLKLNVNNMPILDGALKYAQSGVQTSAHVRNRAYLRNKVSIETTLDVGIESVLFDPQTSGGLLISIQKEQANRLRDYFFANNLSIWCIGEVHEGEGVVISR